jgi:hypothetical protein
VSKPNWPASSGPSSSRTMFGRSTTNANNPTAAAQVNSTLVKMWRSSRFKRT